MQATHSFERKRSPPSVAGADVRRMREQLLFEGPDAGRKLTRFWTLLALASVIASAGIVSDSTATVIGAMIVAPLMTPILGTVLSIVIGDGPNLARSVALVIGGAVSVALVGYVVGLAVPFDVVSETSSQVAGRVHPRLIDLIAALATGAVGSFALVRSDIADTLPGVAIAISLVPPLAVVGITLEAGATDESLGALLLFMTNVGAILLSGLVVMSVYRVRRVARRTAEPGRSNRLSLALVALFVAAIAVPLAATSQRITSETLNAADVSVVATDWAEPVGWRVDEVVAASDAIVVRAAGASPAPSPAALRQQLDDAGLGDVRVRLVLVPEQRVDLEPG